MKVIERTFSIKKPLSTTQSSDVLNIAIVKTNLKYTIENLNQLFSDHNPIMMDIEDQIHRTSFPISQKNCDKLE